MRMKSDIPYPWTIGLWGGWVELGFADSRWEVMEREWWDLMPSGSPEVRGG